MNNRTLAIAAVVLMAISIWSYRNSVTRAERFERGQKFLPQLNPDNIFSIEISKGEETASLKRDGDRFVVTSLHNYPAKNETVNRLLRDVADIGLEKPVGSGEKLEKELGLTADGEEATTVVFKNDAGKEMVHFVVGNSTDGGQGRFLKRLDGGEGKIFLSSKGVYLTTAADGFLDKEILNHNGDEVVRVEGKDFVIAANDGTLALEGVPAGKKENATEVNQVKNMLSYLRFDKVFLADDPQVTNLAFDNTIKVKLKDQSGYQVSVAKKDDTYFMKIHGTFDVEQIQLKQDETEEELKEKSEILSRSDEINTFNEFHGSWVYQLGEFSAKKFLKTKKDLIQAEKEES